MSPAFVRALATTLAIQACLATAFGWQADNGNGTFSNPLFYEEHSDPDMIRVGEDYYLTGTTMHVMPGLPILHSRDLVNWRLIAYAFDRLDWGPAFRLQESKEVYGQGIWAPCFRYHQGTFYIFANVNGFGTQVFTTSQVAGPWKHHRMKLGDVAGLALLNKPYAWIGVARETEGCVVRHFDQTTGKTLRQPARAARLWLRVHCNFDAEKADFGFSADGKSFTALGGEYTMVYQLKTFQGVRCGLFHFNEGGAAGGHADFDNFIVDESRPRGFTAPIPTDQVISLKSRADESLLKLNENTAFRVADRGRGRVALQPVSKPRFVTVEAKGTVSIKPGPPDQAATFQWIELDGGDLCLLSLATHRYLAASPKDGSVSADKPGPSPTRKAGVSFTPVAANSTSADPLLLKDYRPHSIFNVPQTRVDKARFPVIDVHSHAYAKTGADIDRWVRTMDTVGIAKTVVLTGATGKRFDDLVALYQPHGDRFELWCGIDYTGFDQPGFGPAAVAELERCVRVGAAGVGELSDKGGGLRGNSGGLHLDDPRMDSILEKCADSGLAVNIHVGEDRWMYEPMDRRNDGLMNAFTWRIPENPGILRHADVVATLERAVKKHRRTTFIACHFANCCYDLSILSRMFQACPNLYADISARYGETAPIPRYMARFFEAHQDRLLYGTDMGFDPEMYRTTFRILETEDEHFYAQNLFNYHWPLHGFGLKDGVFGKVYGDNARKLLKPPKRTGP